MTDYITEAAQATSDLINAANQRENADYAKTTGLANLLAALIGAESAGDNVNTVKRQVFATNGWSYKEYDAGQDKMITVDGGKAPANVSTAYSEAKRAYIQFGTLANFGSWEEMRKRCKPIDPLNDIKNTQKAILKSLKAINHGDWNDYALGVLENLDTELAKVVANKKTS